jgi:hypothetical protein
VLPAAPPWRNLAAPSRVTMAVRDHRRLSDLASGSCVVDSENAGVWAERGSEQVLDIDL